MKRSEDLMLFNAKPYEHVYKGLFLFLAVYIGASLFASILTPPTYWLVEWVDKINPCRLTKYLLGKRVDIFYDRLRWAPIVVALPWVLKYCGLLSWRNLGIAFDKYSLKLAAKFWTAGLCIAALVYAVQTLFAGAKINAEAAVLNVVVSAVLGSVILGFLEEIVFRGLIMRCVYTAIGAVSAIVLSSLFFAYKHFKVPSSIWNHMPENGHAATWDSGFLTCYYDTVGIAYEFGLIEFASLFLFGSLLCMLYVRTRSLLAPISFHAGAIFCMMIFSKCFELGTNEYAFWLGTKWFSDGVLGLCVCSLFLLYTIFFMKDSGRSLR